MLCRVSRPLFAVAAAAANVVVAAATAALAAADLTLATAIATGVPNHSTVGWRTVRDAWAYVSRRIWR